MNAGKGNEWTQVNGQSCTLKPYAQEHSLQYLGKEPGRIALPVLRYSFRCPAGQQTTAAASALGSHVDDVVGKFDDIKVVLDDQDGIATVDKFLQDTHEDSDVFKVKSRRRLVKDIKRLARVPFGKFGSQFDTLALPTG